MTTLTLNKPSIINPTFVVWNTGNRSPYWVGNSFLLAIINLIEARILTKHRVKLEWNE